MVFRDVNCTVKIITVKVRNSHHQIKKQTILLRNSLVSVV